MSLASIELSKPRHADLEKLLIHPAESQLLYSFDFVEDPQKSRKGLQTELPGAEMFRDRRLTWLLSSILQPPLEKLLQDGPLWWPHPFLEHQTVGIAALLHNRELLLADDMGLGKTIQVIAALKILCYRQLSEAALIVAPAPLMRQWQNELESWAGDLKVVRINGAPGQRAALWRLPAHIYLVSYEMLREDEPSKWVTGRSWDVVVLDEASKIKNSESRVSNSVKRLKAKRRWALTGTPIENRIEDLYSILGFLVTDRSRFGGNLLDLLAQVHLRRRKGDVLKGLPPKTVVTMPLELGARQKQAYDAAAKDGVYRLRALGADLRITHILELLVRLKQLCNVEPVSGDSAKLDDIERRLEELVAQGHRSLVFSQFTDEVFGAKFVAARLSRFQPLVFTGAMSERERVDVLDRFKSDHGRKALILSLKAGGMGLNLQSASYVFHLDRWWNPAIEDQAEARSHRFGQFNPVTVYRYVCLGTIEERIEHLVQDKRDLFAQIIDAQTPMSLGKEALLNIIECNI
jgi:SNF2 family DNA or RNA helicase